MYNKTLEEEKITTIIWKHYLQYLYKIRFLQTFAKLESQRRAMEDVISDYPLNILWRKCSIESKRKGF